MIQLDEVFFSYREGEPILEGITVEIPRGLTLVVGPNGAGKSTFLKIIAGVEKPERGRACIDGYDLWREEIAARRCIAYVPEQPDLTPYATLMDILKLVCRLRSEAPSAAREVLERAGLGALGNRSVRELSLGQRRRAVLAAAWIGRPRVLILDEPLEALDRAMKEMMLSWVDKSLAEEVAVVLATHDIEPFASRADRALGFHRRRYLLLDTLPQDPAQRLRRLEALSRGSAAGAEG